MVCLSMLTLCSEPAQHEVCENIQATITAAFKMYSSIHVCPTLSPKHLTPSICRISSFHRFEVTSHKPLFRVPKATVRGSHKSLFRVPTSHCAGFPQVAVQVPTCSGPHKSLFRVPASLCAGFPQATVQGSHKLLFRVPTSHCAGFPQVAVQVPTCSGPHKSLFRVPASLCSGFPQVTVQGSHKALKSLNVLEFCYILSRSGMCLNLDKWPWKR